jgi:hypothetical protein
VRGISQCPSGVYYELSDPAGVWTLRWTPARRVGRGPRARSIPLGSPSRHRCPSPGAGRSVPWTHTTSMHVERLDATHHIARVELSPPSRSRVNLSPPRKLLIHVGRKHRQSAAFALFVSDKPSYVEPKVVTVARAASWSDAGSTMTRRVVTSRSGDMTRRLVISTRVLGQPCVARAERGGQRGFYRRGRCDA